MECNGYLQAWANISVINPIVHYPPSLAATRGDHQFSMTKCHGYCRPTRQVQALKGTGATGIESASWCDQWHSWRRKPCFDMLIATDCCCYFCFVLFECRVSPLKIWVCRTLWKLNLRLMLLLLNYYNYIYFCPPISLCLLQCLSRYLSVVKYYNYIYFCPPISLCLFQCLSRYLSVCLFPCL